MEGTESDIKRHPQENDAENESPISLQIVISKGQESQTQSPKDSSVADSNKFNNKENESASASANACRSGLSPMEISDKVQTSNTSLDVGKEQLCQNLNTNSISVNGTDVKNAEEIYIEPKIGTEFESEDHAYKCYNKYAVLKGFSIRKDFVNKSKVDGAVVSRRFTCHRQGFRSNKKYTNLKRLQEETRTGCYAHMTISRHSNGRFRVTSFDSEHNHAFVTPCNAHMLPSLKRLNFAQAVEVNVSESVLDGVPKLGMGFDSEKHAYEFYNTYAGRVGFSVRKDYVNKSKVDGAVASRRFTCFREGFRKKDKQDMSAKRRREDIRIGCLAQLIISRQPDGRYHVTHFEVKHNHDLVSACRVHMLRSQKRLAAIRAENNIADGSRVLPKAASVSFHDLNYDSVDYECKLPFRCTREIKEEETEKIRHYFQSKQSKNSSFFYAFQLDVDDQITNIFWADEKMITDYSDFGDVVCFDTSYKFYKDSRPFAPFLGINNHMQMVIFGAALLYDDSVESLKWLFRVFIGAMSRSKPKTILTDQDAMVSEAVKSILPQTNQRFCVWHVYQDALKQLSHMSVESDSFVNDFRRCLFDHDEEENFVNAWNALVDKYSLSENEWLRQLYESRDQWGIAYGRHIFCADIPSLLMRENLTNSLKKHLMNDTRVHFDSSNVTVNCSCRKFEYMGVLCCHALKVLDYRNIRIVPSQYILKRWTKHSRA